MSDGSGLVFATPAHAAAMAAIHATSYPPRERWGADAMELQLGLPGAFGLIDPEGGLILARQVADEAEILTLAVTPGLRCQRCSSKYQRVTMLPNSFTAAMASL